MFTRLPDHFYKTRIICSGIKILFVLSGVLISSPASSNPFDLYGFNPRAISLAGAQTAGVDDFTATYYNPASLTTKLDVNFGFGMSTAIYDLYIDLQKGSSSVKTLIPDDDLGYTMGVLFPLGGKVKNLVVLGMGLYIPSDKIFRAESIDPHTPQFYMYQNLPERIVVLGAIGVRFNRYVSAGAGVQSLGHIIGKGITFYIDPTNRTFEQKDFTVDLDYTNSITAGLLISPTEHLRLGLSFREGIDLIYNIPAKILFEDLQVESNLQINGVTQWTPHQLSFGIDLDLKRMIPLRLLFDFVYLMWSDAPDPSVSVQLDSEGDDLEKLGLEDAADFPSEQLKIQLGFRDTAAWRFGIEYTILKPIKFRMGYAYWPTPIPVQSSYTNLIDTSHHSFCSGLGFTFKDPMEVFRKPITFDIAAQLILLRERYHEKRVQEDDVGNYRTGGKIFSIAVAVRYDY